MSKIGRNDPCPCGSGKKYKKCCLNADQSKARVTERDRLGEITFTTSIAQQAPTALEATTTAPAAAPTAAVSVGKEYVVRPANPRKTKHRDRRVLVLELVANEEGATDKAEVKFLDTNRKGRVDVEDLVPAE